MNGRVDESLRALLDVSIRTDPAEAGSLVSTWIDTAFNGHLVFSKHLIEELGLRQEAATEAVLADGTVVTLESYICYVDWCGNCMPAQVIANDGKMPLLGTELLADCLLVIDYNGKNVTVSF